MSASANAAARAALVHACASQGAWPTSGESALLQVLPHLPHSNQPSSSDQATPGLQGGGDRLQGGAGGNGQGALSPAGGVAAGRLGRLGFRDRQNPNQTGPGAAQRGSGSGRRGHGAREEGARKLRSTGAGSKAPDALVESLLAELSDEHGGRKRWRLWSVGKRGGAEEGGGTGTWGMEQGSLWRMLFWDVSDEHVG